jgi:type 1 glutamine amidotransferase
VKRALIVWGGPDFHEPEAGAAVVRGMLEAEGFAVTVTGDYAALGGPDIASYDLIMPQVTDGQIEREVADRLCDAVAAGSGLAGFHYGLATSFRGALRFRFMSSATFVGHPGNIIRYRVDPASEDPIVAGIGSFEHTSEQYYLHVDPAVEVLATTLVTGKHAPWRTNVTMPVVYKTNYGSGRVFYTALGHKAAELEIPQVREILRRGMLWAAR